MCGGGPGANAAGSGSSKRCALHGRYRRQCLYEEEERDHPGATDTGTGFQRFQHRAGLGRTIPAGIVLQVRQEFMTVARPGVVSHPVPHASGEGSCRQGGGLVKAHLVEVPVECQPDGVGADVHKRLPDLDVLDLRRYKRPSSTRGPSPSVLAASAKVNPRATICTAARTLASLIVTSTSWAAASRRTISQVGSDLLRSRAVAASASSGLTVPSLTACQRFCSLAQTANTLGN